MTKTIILLILWLLYHLPMYANPNDPNILWTELEKDVFAMKQNYVFQLQKFSKRTKEINYLLAKNQLLEKKVNLLIEKEQLKEQIELLNNEAVSDISKVRYLKGLQIIKLLYEKVLSLDHHFASVRTFSEINKMANPNQYPEFDKLKTLVKDKKDKKQGFDLTQVLGTNTIVSVINTFSNMLVSSMSKEEKEKELQNIDCILDFTLRMQNDLNTIYFETAFLQKSNESVKLEIENLFKDYTKPINYDKSLADCRKQDDWDKIKKLLDDYLKGISTAEKTDVRKLQVELSFPIDRLLGFINQYNTFINDGEQFYQKFNIILNSYENEKQCETKLPLEYKKLKQDINIAIDKFHTAYKPIEVNGSKMKEILYGINEFM